MALIFVTIVYLLVALAVSSALTLAAAKIVRAPPITYLTAMKLTFVVGGLGLFYYIADVTILKSSDAVSIVAFLVYLAISVYFTMRFIKVRFKSGLAIYLISGLVSSAIMAFLVYPWMSFHVRGSSMSPTLSQDDLVMASRLNRIIGGTSYIPKRGEIIIYHFPRDTSKIFISRVVGLPGDRVVIANGQVTIFNQSNATGLKPDTISGVTAPNTLIDTDIVVPERAVFVIGDNRAPNGAYDSREWGPLPISDIISEVTYRVVPTYKAL